MMFLHQVNVLIACPGFAASTQRRSWLCVVFSTAWGTGSACIVETYPVLLTLYCRATARLSLYTAASGTCTSALMGGWSQGQMGVFGARSDWVPSSATSETCATCALAGGESLWSGNAKPKVKRGWPNVCYRSWKMTDCWSADALRWSAWS